MKFRVVIVFAILALFSVTALVYSQVDSVIGQFTNSFEESFAGGTSGDGRFVVFESRGNIATDNPRNTDGNVEIFLFDYAQRRIFQITDTKSVLFNTSLPGTFNNVRVEISNKRPVISNDGRWIAFSSNATTSTPAVPDATNPGSFDGNTYTAPTPTPLPSPTPTVTPTPTPAANPLTNDANLEMWLYQIPPYAPVADLTTGDELPVTDLSGGAFIRVTNTITSRLPQPGSNTTGAFIADDNHDASISDDGNVIAFGSTRDLITGGNTFPNNDNDEIFTYVRSSSTLNQVTQTPRGPIIDPIYNKNPTISGDGSRVVFASTGDNPIIGMTGGSNPSTSRNEEIFVSELTGGAPSGIRRQVTTTTPTNPGDPVNILDLGRRMSRDGRFIAFDSYADLASEHSGTNQTSFALFLYDFTNNNFRRIGPRSTADSQAAGGDVARYPGFTDYDVNGVPASMVLETRQNIKPDGTIPTTQSEGLNPDEFRPTQIYTYNLDVPPANAIFKRLTKLPISSTFLASTQPLPSNSSKRIAFNLALTELGTGNGDLQSEIFYLYQPNVTNDIQSSFDFGTGASRIPVSLTAVPTPTPTPSPTPTPTPSPTPTPTPTPTPGPTPSPTPTPTPVPTPTPQTPPAVLGLSPGMLAVVNVTPRNVQPIVTRTGVGSLSRSFTLPIELSGVTVTINGAACGLKSVTRLVNRYEIFFVVPPGLTASVTGTTYPLVVNVRGAISRSDITIVPARPDLFSDLPSPGPGGRALITNVTNRVHTTEPFTATTIRIRGGARVPTVLRVRLTGVQNLSASNFTIRIGSFIIFGNRVLSGGVLVEPGVYTVDFLLPPLIDGAGDQPIVIEASNGSIGYTSRLDDTAPRLRIL